MSVDTHELREILLQSDQEFRGLALKHHELDDRLHELSARPFLSAKPARPNRFRVARRLRGRARSLTSRPAVCRPTPLRGEGRAP